MTDKIKEDGSQYGYSFNQRLAYKRGIKDERDKAEKERREDASYIKILEFGQKMHRKRIRELEQERKATIDIVKTLGYEMSRKDYKLTSDFIEGFALAKKIMLEKTQVQKEL